MEDLRDQHSTLADRLRNNSFRSAAIFLDPDRSLLDSDDIQQTYPNNTRAPIALRREHSNSTGKEVSEEHQERLDSRQMRGKEDIPRNDLLIGESGNGVLRGHQGDDVLIGGQARDHLEGGADHDTIRDTDGRCELHRGGQLLTGGVRSDPDPAGSCPSEDGRLARPAVG